VQYKSSALSVKNNPDCRGLSRHCSSLCSTEFSRVARLEGLEPHLSCEGDEEYQSALVPESPYDKAKMLFYESDKFVFGFADDLALTARFDGARQRRFDFDARPDVVG